MDTATNIFTTYTNLASKEGVYNLRLKAYYSGYSNVFSRDFSITVTDVCKNAVLTLGFTGLDGWYKIKTAAVITFIDES